MKIAEHIKQSLDAADRGELDQTQLSACIAVDGIAKKMFPGEPNWWAVSQGSETGAGDLAAVVLGTSNP
jgi:hypothetical protein